MMIFKKGHLKFSELIQTFVLNKKIESYLVASLLKYVLSYK